MGIRAGRGLPHDGHVVGSVEYSRCDVRDTKLRGRMGNLSFDNDMTVALLIKK